MLFPEIDNATLKCIFSGGSKGGARDAPPPGVQMLDCLLFDTEEIDNAVTT